jgi:putative tryptophan/tyrosine transport system substrate-binding protein
MRRREFIAGLGSAAAWPVTARAQQQAHTPVIGFLSGRSPRSSQYLVAAFRTGLGEAGFIEGQNVAVEYRWANDQYDRIPVLAAELVSRRVAVIATSDTASALAAKAATASIPIVFTLGADPVKFGLVASLSRPGANVTGTTNLSVEIGPKRLQLIHDLLPKARLVGFLTNPTNPNASSDTREMQVAADNLALPIHILRANNESEFAAAFAALAQLQAQGLVIEGDAMFTSRSAELAALTLRYGVPTIYQFREFAASGGLMSYGASITNSHRLVGDYVGRILKGDKPVDLPVQQVTKVELIVNLNTAKALRISVPETLLAIADEVIE